MKVYVVKRGWENPDCSPEISAIFSSREAAVKWIEEEVAEDILSYEKYNRYQVRQVASGPSRWAIEVKVDDWPHWMADLVWLLEEHLMINGKT